MVFGNPVARQLFNSFFLIVLVFFCIFVVSTFCSFVYFYFYLLCMIDCAAC